MKNQIVIQTERNARHEWLMIATENQNKANAQKSDALVTFYRRCAVNAFANASKRGALLCC